MKLPQICLFLQAFSEFLGRPKTVFDLKDRGVLLLLLTALVLALEALVWWWEHR